MAKTYRSIAHIQKTHGRNGEVVAVPAHGLPALLREGIEVAVVPPELKGPRWRSVVSCSEGGSAQLVRLGGVDTLSDAAALVGKTVLARTEDLPDDVGLKDADALIGREVEDVRLGDIGSIREVLRGPAQDVWAIDGRFGEVLVPVVDAIVVSFEEGSAIVVDLPRGLVDEGSRP